MAGMACWAAETICSLEEPWRGRFVGYVARRLGRDGRQPTREELARWLSGNPVLTRQVALMLWRWTGGRCEGHAGR